MSFSVMALHSALPAQFPSIGPDRQRSLRLADGSFLSTAKAAVRFDRQSFADRAEGVAVDNSRGGNATGDAAADVGELHGTARQEHGIDVRSRDAGLLQT